MFLPNHLLPNEQKLLKKLTLNFAPTEIVKVPQKISFAKWTRLGTFAGFLGDPGSHPRLQCSPRNFFEETF